MYIMTSSCPHCGAPIYVPAESSSGEPMLLESGVWLAVQPPTYSCECREYAIVAPKEGKDIKRVISEAQHKPRRANGNASEYSAFGKGPREE